MDKMCNAVLLTNCVLTQGSCGIILAGDDGKPAQVWHITRDVSYAVSYLMRILLY
jgi:hypothetical protein